MGLLIKFALCIPFCIAVGLLFEGCDSSCLMSAHGHGDETACDTTWTWSDSDSCKIRLIDCTTTVHDTTIVVETDTLFVAVTDTVIVLPNYASVEDCVKIRGLGHWRECLEVCVEAG